MKQICYAQNKTQIHTALAPARVMKNGDEADGREEEVLKDWSKLQRDNLKRLSV